eukprot:TRINITY_DN112182_c0_g1_i1.p1 TRINITY_DN112182_c0_g1~~TRINITY_DN112182_c0_g1_i1.p1  ORF type:complete len:199 (+),score=25.41 TRINITY_DN112182_c0_g1_i1:56-652(+)
MPEACVSSNLSMDSIVRRGHLENQEDVDSDGESVRTTVSLAGVATHPHPLRSAFGRLTQGHVRQPASRTTSGTISPSSSIRIETLDSNLSVDTIPDRDPVQLPVSLNPPANYVRDETRLTSPERMQTINEQVLNASSHDGLARAETQHLPSWLPATTIDSADEDDDSDHEVGAGRYLVSSLARAPELSLAGLQDTSWS